jgi:hypothetical protein
MAVVIEHATRRKRFRHPLIGELSIVLIVKITLIVLAGIFLFGSDHRLHVDKNVLSQHLFEPNPPSTGR